MSIITRSMSRSLKNQQPKAQDPSTVKIWVKPSNYYPAKPLYIKPVQTPVEVQSEPVEVKNYSEEDKRIAIPSLITKLRSLDIWYRMSDSHCSVVAGKKKEDEYIRELNQYNLNLADKIDLLNNDVFSKYSVHSKNILRKILGIPILMQ